MAEELGWSEAEQLKQKEEALSFLRTQMGKDLNKASRDSIPVSLTKAEIAEYVNRFNSLDGDKKGFVSINDIRKSLQVHDLPLHFAAIYGAVQYMVLIINHASHRSKIKAAFKIDYNQSTQNLKHHRISIWT